MLNESKKPRLLIVEEAEVNVAGPSTSQAGPIVTMEKKILLERDMAEVSKFL